MATILIVDDRASNREFLTSLLGYGGHRLLEAGNGVEALNLVRVERPDLVITDILMPIMDGYEFAKKLRAEPAIAATPVIFYTATYSAADAEKLAKSCGVLEVLAKPSEPQAIFDAVNRCLGVGMQMRDAPSLGNAPVATTTKLTAYLDELNSAERMPDKLMIVQRFTGRLVAMDELAANLMAERDPKVLVTIFVKAARRILGASYAAIGMLDWAENALVDLRAEGFDAELLRSSGLNRERLPGALLSRKLPLRAELGAADLPPGHPEVDGFLGLPVTGREGTYGWVYFTNRPGEGIFREVDEYIAAAMVAQLAMLYESAAQKHAIQHHAAKLQVKVAEREQAQEALREREAGLRRAQEMARLAHVITGPDGTFESWSETLPQLIGVNPARIPRTTRDWLELLHPDDRAIFREASIGAGVGGTRADIEYRLRRGDGAWIHVRQVFEPLAGTANAKGRMRWFNTLQDVTEQKLVAEALRESDERFRAIIDKAGVGIAQSDLSGRLVTVNPKFCEMTGYTQQEALSCNIRDLTYPDDRQLSSEAWGRLLAGASAPYGREVRVLRKDGSHFWANITTSVVRDADGKPFHFISVMNDVTERKTLEQAVHKAEQMYRAIFDNAVEGIFLVDAKGRVASANPRLARMLGHESLESMSKDISSVAREVYVDRGDRGRFRELINTQGVVEDFETQWRRRDGSTFWVSLTGSRVLEETGGQVQHLGMARDITDRKEAEVRIKGLNRVYAVLSGINALIVRVSDRDGLFEGVCRIAVEAGQFSMCWLGLVDWNAMKIVPVASAGASPEYMASIKDRFSLAEVTPMGTTLAARAIREKKPFFSNDTQNDPKILFRTAHGQRGTRSLALLPLLVADEAVGVLALYAEEPGFFDEQELKLLTELAGNIAFALDHLERNRYIAELTVARADAEQALRESEERFRAIIDKAGVGIAQTDLSGRLVTVNPKLCEMIGYTREEALSHNIRDLTFPDDVQKSTESRARLLTGSSAPYEREVRIVHKDGSHIWAHITTSLVHGPDGNPLLFISVLHDVTERKRAEEAQRESELRFRQLAENIHEVFFLIDAASTQTLYVNPAYEQIWQRSTASLYENSLSWTELIHPDDRAKVFANVGSMKRTGQSDHEYRILRGDGSLRWIHARTYPIRNDAGEIYRIAGVVEDITQGKQATQELRESESRFRSLTALSSDWYWEQDGEYRYVRFSGNDSDEGLSNEHRRALGLRRWELPGVSPVSGSWDDHKALLAAHQPIRNFEYKHTSADGTLQYIAASCDPIFDASGRFTGYCGVATDITARKEAENRIKRQNRVYAVLSGINALIVRVVDRDELLDGACRIAVEAGQFHMCWVGLVDRNAMKIVPVASAGAEPEFLKLLSDRFSLNEDSPMGSTMSARAVREKRAIVSNEVVGDTKVMFAKQRIARGIRSMAILPLLIGDEVTGVLALYAEQAGFFDAEELKLLTELAANIALALDHLERNRYIAELTVARADAEQANRAKSEFLASMSHEIRTPMNGVIGIVEVLARSNLSEQQRDLVDTIRNSGSTLLRIIDDILDFSKIEAGRLELNRVSVCVAEVAEGLADSLAQLADTQGVDLALFVSPEIPQTVFADDVRLRQVLYNLVGNAIKFSGGRPERPGRVSMRVELVDAAPLRLAFRIADNGVGMATETLRNLFTPFTQAEVSTTRRFGGTGLGLAICSRLVGLMQGEIAVESTLGEGSTFTVNLPVERAPDETVSVPDLSGLDCVVVVGPNLNGDDVRAYLEHAGARVHAAADLKDAARRAGSLAASVVLLAMGRDRVTIEALRAAFAGVPKARHVLITRGRRRSARVEAPGVVTLDCDVLRRQALLRAVMVAAGRASPEVLHERSQDRLLEQERIAPSIAEARVQGGLILVAEDDDINQKVILQQLRLLGYAAEIAVNGAEALRMWREGNFAVLLTDLHMPKMDGYELTQTIRREEAGGRRMPILALTANAIRGEENRAQAVGVDEYLTKPVQLDVLGAALHKWLPRTSPSASPAPPPEETRGAKAAQVLDVAVLKKLVSDDADTVTEFLTEYLASARRHAVDLRAACAVHDARQVGAIAHKLKSSSRSVGALALGDRCAGLENAGKAADRAAIAHEFPIFETAFAAVETAIVGYLSGH